MVHDDVYKIIKYTVQKTMSGELAQRALDWWAGLVEHLFGLPERTPEQEKAVVPAAEDHSTRHKVSTQVPVELKLADTFHNFVIQYFLVVVTRESKHTCDVLGCLRCSGGIRADGIYLRITRPAVLLPSSCAGHLLHSCTVPPVSS